VGLIPDIDNICTQGWKTQGDLIYLLGLPLSDTTPHVSLGGSEYLASIHGLVAGKPPLVNFDLECRVQAACREGIRQGWVKSAHDCAEGGITVAVAESCISGGLGAEINLELTDGGEIRWDRILFGESASRILVSVSSAQQANWESYLKEYLGESVDTWQLLGVVGAENSSLRVVANNNQLILEVTIPEMCDRYHNAIEERLSDISYTNLSTGMV
jgi:phosphoribosylformylglycinamidine synthase subunit PurL